MINVFRGSILFHIARLSLSGFLFCTLPACKNSDADINKVRTMDDKKMKDHATEVTIYYSDRGQVKAVIHAAEMFRNESATPPYTDIRKGVKVEFMNDSLQVESTLTARSARIFEAEGNVIVRDSVVVINKKGERLDTEELVWNQRADKFYTTKNVVIRTPPDQVMNGTGLEANSDFTWYKITRLRGNISVQNEEIPQ